MINSKILRVIWAVVWRVLLVVVVLGLLAATGVVMTLNMIFTGPSETARNTLTATMLQYEATRMIPGYFLEESVMAEICSCADSLPASVSDPSLIDVSDSGTEWDQRLTVGQTTASVSLAYGQWDPTGLSGGDCYAGFTAEGVLVVSTTADAGVSGNCEKILIMDGQINTGLYNSISGYAPRSAIGQTADGGVITVTMDQGTYQDLIDILAEYGAVNACALPVSEE